MRHPKKTIDFSNASNPFVDPERLAAGIRVWEAAQNGTGPSWAERNVKISQRNDSYRLRDVDVCDYGNQKPDEKTLNLRDAARGTINSAVNQIKAGDLKIMTISKQEFKEVISGIGNATLAFKDEAKTRIDDLTNEVKSLGQEVAQLKTPSMGGSSWSANGDTTYGTTNSQAKNPERVKAFNNFIRSGEGVEALRKFEIQAGMSTLEDPAGGYTIIPEYNRNIDLLAQNAIALRRIARVETIKGSELLQPVCTSEAESGWVSEKGARPTTASPELGMISTVLHELYSNIPITQKLIDTSSVDIGGFLTERIGDSFIQREGTAFISGDGVGQPFGLIQESKMVPDASYAFGKTGFVKSGNATLINNPDCLIDLQRSLNPIYRANGVWLMNDSTLATIRTLKDGSGNYLWAPGLVENSPDTLLGCRVEVDSNMPDIGAGEYPIAFGDFRRAYLILDHVTSIRLLRDPFSLKGSVLFYCTKRCGGNLVNPAAVKFLKVSA